MRGSRAALLLFLVACAAAQEGKPPAVEGTVTNSLSGEPVAKAHVSLQAESGPRYGAITLANGKFSIAAVPPGRYTASVERNGYLQAANTTGSTVEWLEVKASDQPARLDLRLVPQAVVTGRVVDANGEPLENVRVTAMRGATSQSAETNRRGEFRISGLRAGRYRLRAAPSEGSMPPEIRTDGTEELHFGPADFPSLVETRPGTDTSGIEVRLQPSKIVRVSGLITGIPASAKDYVLEHDFGPDFTNSTTTSMLKNPRFVIWRLPPDIYRVSVWCHVAGGTLHSAPVDVQLGGSNIDNIELTIVPPFEVKGQVDGDLPPPTEESVPRAIVLRSIGPRGEAGKPAGIGPDGAFVFPRVQPDRYRLLPAGMPANIYVKDPGPILDLTHGAPGSGIKVTLGTATSRIFGTVQNEKGAAPEAMVGLVRDEPYGGDVFRSAATSTDGKYAFDAVAPGKYKLFVFDRADLDSLKRGVGTAWYAEDAERVEVADGGSVTCDLKVR